MIRGPNYVFLNIPHTGSEEIEQLLFKRCKGQVVTPTYETLMEVVDKKTKVFAVTRKPFHRAMEIAEVYGRGEKPIDYLTWLKTRGTLYVKPYSYWIDNCTNIFKVEEVHEKLSPFLLSLGYKVTVPKIDTQTFETTIEEAEFIKKAFKDDFIQAMYTTDRRTNT